MTIRWISFRVGLVATLAALLIGAAGVPQAEARGAGGPAELLAPSQQATRDIVDTAVAAGSFRTLVQAVQAAGLVETLKGSGPFTVFAPTDEAFAKVPPATLQALLANPAALRDVLTYHVVSGRVQAADVIRLTTAKTVQGGNISIAVSGSSVRLNGSVNVTQTDILASNGVIHVIDNVLLPPAPAAAPAPPATGNAGLADGGSSSMAIPLAGAALASVLLLAFGARYAVGRIRAR